MKPISDDELRWLLVDWDGTIFQNTGHPDYTPTIPVEGAREALKKLEGDGWKIIVYTARAWASYKSIEDLLIEHDIPFRRIICGKPLGHYIIDDRAIGFRGDWDRVLGEIRDNS